MALTERTVATTELPPVPEDYPKCRGQGAVWLLAQAVICRACAGPGAGCCARRAGRPPNYGSLLLIGTERKDTSR